MGDLRDRAAYPCVKLEMISSEGCSLCGRKFNKGCFIADTERAHTLYRLGTDIITWSWLYIDALAAARAERESNDPPQR